MSKVAVVKCDSYDLEKVRKAVEQGIGLIGGVGAFAKKGERILLKPNLLVGEHPDKCVTTHPAVFRAVAEVLRSTGAVLSYGDSPAIGSPGAVAEKTGLAVHARELGVRLADFETGAEVFFEKGLQNRKFVIARAVAESDGTVSIPKMKTHGLEKISGCVKNQFGCVPGLLKPEFHAKLPDAVDFARMLVDLNSCIHPRLYVVDGIRAMEGNGPRGGVPRAMNVLLLSSDPIALDATICRLMDLDPELVPTISLGAAAGAGVSREDQIEITGDSIEAVAARDFDVQRNPVRPYREKGWIRFLNNSLVPKPVIVHEKCVTCGMCVAICPTDPKSVEWDNGNKKSPPVHDYGTCIRCYCCQEMCPEGAIVLKVPFMRKALRVLPLKMFRL